MINEELIEKIGNKYGFSKIEKAFLKLAILLTTPPSLNDIIPLQELSYTKGIIYYADLKNKIYE
jgi:hypothetical protein